MSQFDPVTFLDAQITETLTKRPPLPVGDYPAIITDVEARPWQGREDPTKSGMAYDMQLTIQVSAEIQAALGVSLQNGTITLRDSIMLDLTPQGTIDTGVGKNNKLRRYREALDMNKPGDVFSARKMIGQPILVKVSHDVYQGEPVEKVASIAKL